MCPGYLLAAIIILFPFFSFVAFAFFSLRACLVFGELHIYHLPFTCYQKKLDSGRFTDMYVWNKIAHSAPYIHFEIYLDP